MNSKQRVAVALRGGKPDRVPIVPIFDGCCTCRSTGRDLRVLSTCSSAERISYFVPLEIYRESGGNQSWFQLG